jgi:hypothetical protein
VGLGAFSFGIGGAGDAAKLSLEINPDDTVTIYRPAPIPGRATTPC